MRRPETGGQGAVGTVSGDLGIAHRAKRGPSRQCLARHDGEGSQSSSYLATYSVMLHVEGEPNDAWHQQMEQLPVDLFALWQDLILSRPGMLR
jgi:hypothetical protein